MTHGKDERGHGNCARYIGAYENIDSNRTSLMLILNTISVSLI